ncbi:hypothetical protein MIND_00998700 [Mycena indigotica]|uniref:DUF6697 domain-containing protein n=1 Tax=Mycena indigotica TaxID=2126181 RepID=A0A8H6S816_9AGAR|nr:uncharacterized protein MIND_00998700 [Mycena indigotica]KAF7294621.1 hypothetical protein MIND_00998700 [Mycena indigotica]
MSTAPALRILAINTVPGLEEFLQVTKETGTQSLKVKDPLSVVEMALEVEVERSRATEALAARDAAIHRLHEACASIRQKMILIEQLQQNLPSGSLISSPNPLNEQVVMLEATIKALREEIVALRSAKAVQPPPYDENGIEHPALAKAPLIRPASSAAPLRLPPTRDLVPRPATASSIQENIVNSTFAQDNNEESSKPLEPEDIIKARHALLAKIPLPLEPPDDTLKPIILPPPFTLHEFLANASGSLRVVLSNYRVLQELTTSWCPEREEHGYMLTPVFKCSTNPRVATAHRWNMVDVMARMAKPTECFYNKDGNWYYAGVYQGFRLADLTAKEWEALSSETTQALVKETISARKNISPQNVYETSQLYTAGALKVACIGLQCVGFNKAVYHAVLEQAARLAAATATTTTTKWTAQNGTKVGLGNGGGVWNVSAAVAGEGGLVEGIGGMRLGVNGEENLNGAHTALLKTLI